MRAMDVLLVSNRVDENALRFADDSSWRKVVVKDIEAAIERMQAIDFDIAAVDKELPEEDRLRLQTMISIQQPACRVATIDFSDTNPVVCALEDMAEEISSEEKKTYNIMDDVF